MSTISSDYSVNPSEQIINANLNKPKKDKDNDTIREPKNDPTMENDEISIEHETNHAPDFELEDVEFTIAPKTGSLNSPKDLSEDERKILDIIGKLEDENMKTIFKAFDESIEHGRKLLEENKEYINKVLIPRENIDKQEKLKEEITKKEL